MYPNRLKRFKIEDKINAFPARESVEKHHFLKRDP
jgi:hypothetical protein